MDAIERGIARRSRRVVAPGLGSPMLPIRMIAQRVVEAATGAGLAGRMEIARREARAAHDRATEPPSRARRQAAASAGRASRSLRDGDPASRSAAPAGWFQ